MSASPMTRRSDGETSTPTPLPASRRRVLRAATVAGAAVVSTLVFAAGRLGDVDFTLTDPGPGSVPHTFTAVEIALVSVAIGLLGWLSLAALERWTTRAHRTWLILAVTITVLSVVPIGIERATSGTRAFLTVIHIVVALALLPLLGQGGPRGRTHRP